MFNGSCCCGNINYMAKGDPIIVAHCHCIDCKKRSGAGHTTGVMFAEKDFTVKGTLSEYQQDGEAGRTTTHFFCTRCGSPIYGKNTEMIGFVTLSAGTLEDGNLIELQVVIFAKYRNHWDKIDSKLEIFDDMPDWKPESGA